MQTRTIFFDESGFTGYNLLDPAQPVFSVASVDIAEERAEEILRRSFPRYQGEEYHFTNIWRSRHRGGLGTFCNHLHEVSELSFCFATNKRFAIFTKIMDFLVEPAITESCFDFYDEGFCWKYSNYAYHGIMQFGSPELLDYLIRFYQDFSRTPTAESLSLLQHRLRMMASSAEPEIRIFLEQMALGADLFERYSDLDDFRNSNDLQTGTMLAVIGHWRQAYTEDFSVVHDNSSNFWRNREMWSKITSSDNPEAATRAGDGSYVEYPLRVVSTEGRDSRLSRSIQFCDVLAGLTAKHFNPDLTADDREFMSSLIDEGLGNISSNRIVPGTEFPVRIPPKRLEGPDVVDQLIEMIHGAQPPE